MKAKLLTLACCMAFLAGAFAQQSVLHENVVPPWKTEAYAAAIMKLKEACVANKVKMSWRTVQLSDNNFAHILPVEGTASVETDLFVELRSKIGEEAFASLVGGIQENMDGRILGTLAFMPGHSFLKPDPGEMYRRFLYIFPLAGKEKEMEDLIMEWKSAYEQYKSPENFNVYRINYGGEQGYVLSLAGKNRVDQATRRQKSIDLLGDTGTKLWRRTSAICKKYFWKEGQIRADLSYLD
jgi:hypothetical protein